MTDAADRLKSALADRYVIGRELGAGGMATVYLAHDVKHDRKVAIKVMRPELSAILGGERFLREVSIAAKLNHPHILALYDSGQAEGFLYYVMPHVEGESLRDKLNREKQLSVDEAISITKQVGAALDYAHEQGVIHRDIKPENILIHQGEALVADFGIALAVTAAGGTRITDTGLSLGTPEYMSPEQATGERELDARSDVYSLGAITYEMLVGEPPHTGNTVQAIIAKVVSAEPQPVSRVRRTVPSNVDAAVMCALAKTPADRFASGAEFAEALSNPVFTVSATVAASAKLSGNRWNRLSVGMTVVAGLFAILSAWGWLGHKPERELMTLRLNLDLGEIIHDPLNDVIVSPDGSAIAVVSIAAEQRGLYKRRTGEERFRLVPGTEGAREPTFSPDGYWILFRKRDALLKVPIEGGEPLVVLQPGFVASPQNPHWGDNGTIVFASNNGLQRILATGGEPEFLLEGAWWAQFPRLLPGGKGLLFTDKRTTSTFLLDLEADSLRPIVPGGLDAMYVKTGHIIHASPNGGLFATPFELKNMKLTGRSVPVLDGVSIWGLRQGSPRAQYAVSDDGMLVYGTRKGSDETRMLVVHLRGDTATIPLAPRSFEDPRWSPDGRSIVYVSGGLPDLNLYTYNVELGATPRQLTFNGSNRFPVWSPDGTSIVFSSSRAGTDGWDIFVASVEGDEPAQLLLSRPVDQFTRHWSTEELVVFEDAAPGGRTDLWIAALPATGGTRPYLQSEADLDDINVSPDGRWAAYQSNETGEEEVYVRRFPEPQQQFQVSNGGGQFPRWAPDGRTVYYWREDDALIDTLFAARVQTEPAFAVLSREPVLTGSFVAEAWDLHPNGDRIVVVQTADLEGEGPERFLVVVNWFEELKALTEQGND